MTNATERQNAILGFIKGYTAAHGYAPTIREIGDAFGISSPNGVAAHLTALRKKGLVEEAQGKKKYRTLRASSEKKDFVEGIRKEANMQENLERLELYDRLLTDPMIQKAIARLHEAHAKGVYFFPQWAIKELSKYFAKVND